MPARPGTDLASCVNLTGSQRLERQYGHVGGDDPSLGGESHDDKNDRRAGNPDENSPAVAEQFGCRAGKSACTSVWQTPKVPNERPIQGSFQWNVSKRGSQL